MPFPFALPTTSATALTDSLSSQTHPSLILTATSQRALVRDVLKRHKRLPKQAQSTNIAAVQDALQGYLPYILGIYNSSPEGFGTSSYGGVFQPSVSEDKDLVTEWRSTLTSGIPGREPARIKTKGVRNEAAFALQTLGYTHSHLARASLLQLSRTTSPSPEARAGFVAAAMKSLLEAHGIHKLVASLNTAADQPAPIDVSVSTASALAALALAEATLIVVSKDDPYAAAVMEDRNKDSKEWMIAAPSIPKVRAHLFARLCVAAADHAQRAASLLPRPGGIGAGQIDEDLLGFVNDLKKTARGKAARFLGIDADASGKTGEAIAWLRGAKRDMGVTTDESSGKRSGLKGLKQSWTERREDRKIEKGAQDWGLDAGLFEEIRVVEWLEAKWTKSNDTVNVQSIPPFEPLLASMPSGREYHSPKPYVPPSLDTSQLQSLQVPVEPGQQAFTGNEDDSGDEQPPAAAPAGAFPGTSSHYGEGGNNYY